MHHNSLQEGINIILIKSIDFEGEKPDVKHFDPNRQQDHSKKTGEDHDSTVQNRSERTLHRRQLHACQDRVSDKIVQ